MTEAPFRQLEESVWRPETRFDRGWMARHLHADFVELGRSGRVYRRRDLLDGIGTGAATTITCELPLPRFEAAALEPAVVLVTYDSQVEYGGAVEHARRAPVWALDAGPWRMRFHQGTPFEPGPARAHG